MSPVAMAWATSASVAICYVLPVLWFKVMLYYNGVWPYGGVTLLQQ